ncbi:hypothetical protein BJ165DRAFT_1526696 [Panaeolus papilionaceus]|nr:hypothetical protein BJ165DRAFT_1526696 [Panaeolus papilionaceus]
MPDNNFSESSDEGIPKNDNHSVVHAEDIGTIYLTSYSHKRGPLVPTPHVTFDLRALPNPPKSVRAHQSGVHLQLREWLFSNPEVRSRFDTIYGSILERVREAEAAGERVLNVGIFCQMGRHRSVTFVEELGRRRFDDWSVSINHRDLHLKRCKLGHRGRDRTDDLGSE